MAPSSANAAAGNVATETTTTAVPTLKVMRLQKPQFHQPTAGSLSFSTSQLSTALCLPDSFGTIAVGETFSAYLGALNTHPNLSVEQLTVQAQLQTPTQRWHLAAPNFDSHQGSGVTVPPGQVVDSIVSHGPLVEAGQHILRVEVGYVQATGGSSGSSGTDGINATTTSTTTKSLRKFYRFQVTQPLGVKSQIWRCGDQAVYVSVEVTNNTPLDEDAATPTASGMTLCGAAFETPAGFVVAQRIDSGSGDGGCITPTISSSPNKDLSALKLYDDCGRLYAGSSRRYLFHVTRSKTGAAADDPNSSFFPSSSPNHRGIAAGDELGKPVFTWRKACGETGRMVGTTLFCPDLPLGTIFQYDGQNISPIETILRGGNDMNNTNNNDFVVHLQQGGGSALSVDVATKAAARAATAGGLSNKSSFHSNNNNSNALDQWLPVTVEPLSAPARMVVGVPTPIPFMVVNHSDQYLTLQLQFRLEHMKGVAVCGPSFVNLEEGLPGHGGCTTVEIRLMALEAGLAKVTGCCVVDLSTGAPIAQPPQFHTLVVSASSTEMEEDDPAAEAAAAKA